MATEQASGSPTCAPNTETETNSMRFYRVPQIKLQTSQFKPGSVYKSKAEMDRAVREGKFDINKTMALKNGQLFFLAYE